MKDLQGEIIRVAKSYVGMEEISGNKGFHNPEFWEKMNAVGFKLGYAWCALFSELVFSEVYDSVKDYKKAFDKLFSANAQRTFKKFSEAGYNVGSVPVVGSVVIWQHVKNGVPDPVKGHAGILISFDDKGMKTIEGNTNGLGSREGEEVAEKNRKFNYHVTKGLQIVGFIYPPDVEINIPFKDKQEGNAFRRWINVNHNAYAKNIDLDLSGSWFNSYIMKAYKQYGESYGV
jgi:hypothetical protein